MRIDEPGIYDMSAEEYHALETPRPALSASLARLLIGASPLHARYQHPTLSPGSEPEERDVFDLGTAAHGLILEGDARVAIIDAKDYRTAAARMQKLEARAAGLTPVLAHRWLDVQQMAESVHVQLDAFPSPKPLRHGSPERTLVWSAGSLWCKARLDWLHDDGHLIEDLKTSENANPDTWARGPLFAMGYDIQAAWYMWGLKCTLGNAASFRFVLAETRPPYAVSVVGLTPEVLMLAEKKMLRALELWGRCLDANEWPGYPKRTVYAELPAWHEAQWLNREMAEQADKPFPVEIS